MAKIALYVRVSTQEQAKEGYSIGEQVERLKMYAEAHKWNITKIYSDAGYSGANMDRPALQDLIKDVKDKKIDKVIVYKLDRLSRSQKDTLNIIEDIFLANSCDFESMNERFDTSTSFGKAMIGILAVFAQLEREQIKERMSMGMEARCKEGKWHGGASVPFGYTYNPDLGYLTEDPYEAMIVKELFTQFATGKKLRQICKEFTDKGFTLRSGKLEPRAARYIMANKTYCGYLRSKGQWIPSKHEAIIDESLFDEVNKILDRNRFNDHAVNSHNYGSRQPTTYLGGLLYCAHCGAKYSKNLSGHKATGYKNIYSCYSRHKKVKSMIMDPNCKNKNYDEAELDQAIFNEVRKLAIDPEYIRTIRKNDNKPDVKAIEDHIRSIDAQISRFMDLYGLGRYSIEELDNKVIPLKEEQQKLQQELNHIVSEQKIPEDQAIKLVTSFDDVLKHGSKEDVRTILEQLIDRIEIDNDNITIHWNFI